MKKKIFLSLFLILLTACSGRENLASTPTLDATVLNATAVSRATADFAQTQIINPTQTLPPILTSTAIPTLDQTRPSFQTPTKEKACNVAAAGHPIDVSVPDGTLMTPGQMFTKTWRLENVGKCSWTRQYAVTFFSGNSMQAQQTHNLAGVVGPGEVVDLSVEMKAPYEPGFYQGNWMLIDPYGEIFGIGPNGDAPFWVQIEVVVSITETPQPSPTVTNTPMIYLTGEILLANQDQVDLDNEVRNPGEVTQVDFLYQQGGDPAHTFSAMNGTEWLVMDEDEPTFEVCTTAALTGAAINFNEVPIGTYICLETSDGLPGWMLFESIENEQLTISFLTWSTSAD